MDGDSRRRIVMINRSFQIKLIVKFLVVNVAVLAIFGIILYLFLNSELDANLARAHASYRNMKDMLFPIVVTLSVINILISSIVITAFVLLASFRIAGPLYRFNAALEAIEKKNLLPMTGIRREDQLYDCSATLTRVSSMLANDIGRLRETVDGAIDAMGSGDEKGNARALGQLREARALLNGYSTGGK